MYTKTLLLALLILFFSSSKPTPNPCDGIVRTIEHRAKLWQQWAKTIKDDSSVSESDKKAIETSYNATMEEIKRYCKKLSDAFPDYKKVKSITINNTLIRNYTVLADSLVYGSYTEFSHSPDVISVAARSEKMSFDAVHSSCLILMSDKAGECYKCLQDKQKKNVMEMKQKLKSILFIPYSAL